MGTFDDIKNDAEDVMKDIPPEQQQKIQQIAQDKGIPLDQAKDHFFNSQNNNQGQQPQDQQQPQAQQQSRSPQDDYDDEDDSNYNQRGNNGHGRDELEEDDRNL